MGRRRKKQKTTAFTVGVLKSFSINKPQILFISINVKMKYNKKFNFNQKFLIIQV